MSEEDSQSEGGETAGGLKVKCPSFWWGVVQRARPQLNVDPSPALRERQCPLQQVQTGKRGEKPVRRTDL